MQNASTCDPGGPSAATVARDAATIVQPRDSRWVPDPDVGRGGDFCDGLSWVAVEGANSFFPARSRQLLIYHDGTFQGTAIRCEAFRGQEVSSTASDAIRVTYRFVDLSIPEQSRKQDPLGRATVTFRWNGSRVVMDGSLPYAFTKGQC
ncbi:LppP/LprE lipoprotein [Williamsia serinedens]|uniref:LppP/LprE lipoprotein n=1 Tax=Williamsia serinedens TaxID=391736 RepID=A0ABT1H3V4_9NOCA|nr:LppP/LprE lipoprotein [Williamsia serinedens]